MNEMPRNIEDHMSKEIAAEMERLNREQGHIRGEVDHPAHYNSHPSGVECIEITEHMNFNLGNAMKYLWRAGLKSDDLITDLAKANWYIEREIARLKRTAQ